MKVYTSGQVARIFGCTARHVNHLIDTKRLKGWKIPNIKNTRTHRRVDYDVLVAYMQRLHIPLERLEQVGNAVRSTN